MGPRWRWERERFVAYPGSARFTVKISDKPQNADPDGFFFLFFFAFFFPFPV